jgi:hypothetical protein
MLAAEGYTINEIDCHCETAAGGRGNPYDILSAMIEIATGLLQ